MREVKILFVCLGNICRSPLAEAIFKEKCKRKGLHNFIYADSCGTGNYHIGSQPDPRTLANAIKNGISIDHACRQLCERDLEDFDYVMAMDQSNFRNILRLSNAARFRDKIKMMRDFDDEAPGTDVPDPYFGGEDGFQNVFLILDRTMTKFVDHLQAKYVTRQANA